MSLLEDAVAGQKGLEVVAHLREGHGPGVDVLDQRVGQVLVDAAGPEVVAVQTSAAGALVEDHQLLALLEAPDGRRQGADVHGLGRHVQQVVQDPADLAVEHADDAAADRHVDVQQLLDGQAEGMFLVHRRHVVEAVEVGDVLEVGAGLHQLLGAAVKQADVRVDPLDHFAVQLQHQAQHAVRGRVLGAEVDVELADRGFRDGRDVGRVVGHDQLPVFSSPGSAYLAPSQGDRKSNCRNSAIFTGS